MRTKNSVYNMIGVLGLYVVKLVFSFIGKTYLIRIMGDQYNGINGLFSNIISMLSIAELGIGSAIVYNLYEPVRNNDIPQIQSIMRFYKRCYHIIAGVVCAIGLAIVPLVPSITGEVAIHENIYVLYLLFLMDSVASYFLSYKRSLLFVYQKNYIISAFDGIYTVALPIVQIAVLAATRNFVLYLGMGILCRIAENLLIHFYVNHKFPYIRERDVAPVSRKVRDDIKEKVKGLLFHNIGSYVVFGTDNILLSRFFGVIVVGFYSNYLTVINPLQNILKQMVTSVQASVGDLLVERDQKKNYSIYSRLEFVNFWLYTAVSVTLFYVIQNFISVWLGPERLFDNWIVLLLALNFWQTGMRNPITIFKTAAGIFYEDRWVPIAESVVNIVASILLAQWIGTAGVFAGTFISSCCLFLYSYPVLVYKPLFGRRPRTYLKELGLLLLQWVLCMLVCLGVARGFDALIHIGNGWIRVIAKALAVFLTVNLTLLLLNLRKRDQLDYLKETVRKLLRRRAA